jgi:uncharacterized membrane protein YgaE (UPF0421/DUF939 family)
LPSWAVLLASIFGIFKFIFIGSSVITIGILLIIFIYSARRSKQMNHFK